MRKVLATGSFLVLGVFGLYYTFTLFNMPPSEVSIRETRPEIALAQIGIAEAQTVATLSTSYPVEDFTADTAYKAVRVIDGTQSKSTTTVKRQTFG